MSRASFRSLPAIIPVATLVVSMASSMADAQSPPTTQPLSACAAAMECGLTPEALVVADASIDASGILGRLESATALRIILTQQHATLDAASAHLGVLAREVTLAGSEVAQAHAAAVTALAEANAALDATRTEVFEFATVGLPASKLQSLAAWRASAGANVPAAFRAHLASSHQWQKIDGALRSEQRAQRRGESLDDESAALLASLRADLDVIAAQSRITQQLHAVNALYTDCSSPSDN